MTDKEKVAKAREIINECGFKKGDKADTEEAILHQMLSTSLYEIIEVFQELEQIIFDVWKVLEG